MELTFLGTSSMVPTKQRNVLGHFLDFNGHGILIDCGEGTQRQMNIAGINRNRVRTILITHWHGDHISGLIGLLQTIGNSENPKPIQIIGPVRTKENVRHLLEATQSTAKMQLTITEVNPEDVETVHEEKEFVIQTAPLRHPVPAVGYSIVGKDSTRVDMSKAKKLGLSEGPNIGKLKAGKTITVDGKTIKPDDVNYVQEGKKITFVFDTAMCETAIDLAKDADLLITEATYESTYEDRAKQYMHLTAEHAAMIASQANVQELVLTHFSQRYANVKPVVAEAKKTFKNVSAAKDFLVKSI